MTRRKSITVAPKVSAMLEDTCPMSPQSRPTKATEKKMGRIVRAAARALAYVAPGMMRSLSHPARKTGRQARLFSMLSWSMHALSSHRSGGRQPQGSPFLSEGHLSTIRLLR